MFHARFWAPLFLCCAVLIAGSSQSASAATLCVNPAGSHGCYSTIAAAVAHAAAFDVINVGPGTYKEDVVIGMPLSLIGAGAGASIIDATGLANGIFVDGFDNAGLGHVNIAGFTVKNANWEGVLVVSASDVVDSRQQNCQQYQGPAVFTGRARCLSGTAGVRNGRDRRLRRRIAPHRRLEFDDFRKYDHEK